MIDSYTVRLLVLDDEPEFIEYFAESLAQEELITYQVSSAVNGTEAKELVQHATVPFDILIVDQRLQASREDGIALVKTLLQDTPTSTAIVLTAYTNLDDAHRALEAGADDYVHKSGDWPEVFRVLKIKLAILASGRRTRREMEWLHELNKAGQRFQACVTRDEVADAILEGALMLGFKVARLWEIFYEDGETWLKGWKQLPADHLPEFEGSWMEMQRSPYSERTLVSRVPLKFQGRELGPSPVDQLYPLSHAADQEGAWLDVPLWNEKRPLAKLSLYHFANSRPLDELALNVVEQYTQQAAAALHRIQLYEQTATSGKLAVINARTTPRTERELDGLLDFIYGHVRAALQADNGFICLLDQATRQMDFRITYRNGRRVKHESREFSPHKGLAGYMLAQEKSLRLTRGVAEFIKEHGLERFPPVPKSWLGVPIRYEKRVLGIVVVRDLQRELAFTEWDQRILEMIADQAASALHNARLSMQAHRAAQQLAMLQYISNDVIRLAPDDLDKMLHVVLTAITASYGLQLNRAMLFLKHPQRAELEGRLGIGHLTQVEAEKDWGRDDETAMTFEKYLERLEGGAMPRKPLEKKVKGLRLKLNDSRDLFTQVFRKGELVHVTLPEQAAQLPTAFRRVVQPLNELWLVPLNTETQTIGVLAVDNRFNQRPVEQETLDRLQVFVNQAALAIENAQEHRTALDRQVAELKAHNELQRAIIDFGMESDLHQVLDSVVKAAKRTLPSVDAITLFYDDPKIGDLRLGGHAGVRLPEMFASTPPRTKSAVRQGLLLKGPRYIKDSAKSKLTKGQFVKREKIVSTAVFPLESGDERIGCMFFSYRKPRDFDEQERTELELFSNQASLAIHNALQNDAVRRSQERLKTVAELTPFINSTLDPEQVVARILQAIQTVVPKAHHAAMLYCDGENGELRFSPASLQWYPIDHPDYRGQLHVHAGEHSIASQVIATGRAVNLSNVKENPEYLPMIHSTQSELCVPIKADDDLLGVLVLESDELNAFTKEDELLLTALADQTAIALKKAREHENLVETQDDLAANSAIALIGLHGSNWSHTVTQRVVDIEGALLLLRRELPTRSEQVETWLVEIQEALQEIKTLKLARQISASPRRSDSDAILLDVVLRRQLEHWRREYPGVELRLKLDSQGAQVAIEEAWLDILLEKLVSNAAKAMGGIGTLTVESTIRDARVEVYVQDTGRGIPEYAKPHLLKRPVPKPNNRGGSGLGLLIGRKVLKAVGGDLVWVSTPPGTGATFMFHLPVVETIMEGS